VKHSPPDHVPTFYIYLSFTTLSCRLDSIKDEGLQWWWWRRRWWWW